MDTKLGLSNFFGTNNTNESQEVCSVTFHRTRNEGMKEFTVTLDIIPEEYKQGKKNFLLNADERIMAYDKAAEVVGEDELSDFVITTAEIVKR